METNFNLHSVYWDNTVEAYLYVIGGIITAWVILQLVKRWVLRWVKGITGHSKNTYDDVLISAVEKFVIPYIYLVINYTIINQLRLTVRAHHILELAMTVVTIFYVVRVINHALHFSVYLYMKRRHEAETRMFQLNGILNVIKVIVWALGLLFLLENLGYNVTTIIAGLGIGGIAIALAAQNILSDLFSYFVIFFDKPFEIGDFVVTGSESGTVEQIGIKTSHIRTLGGEQLIMPNAELVKSAIHNFKRQASRRVVFNLKIDYNTAAEVLEQIPAIIKQIVSAKQNVTFDRAHLQGLNDNYINYEVVYNISSADYTLYMDLQQKIYLELLQEFRQRQIRFAYQALNISIDGKAQQDVKQMHEKNVIEDSAEKKHQDDSK